MSSSSTWADVPSAASEQLCYIHCPFCNTVLAVSVPCSSLFDTVTITCGNCNNMWPVNVEITTALHLSHTGSTSSFQDSSSSHHQHEGNPIMPNYMRPMTIEPRPPSVTNAKEIKDSSPEKRKRIPTLHNQFIKEEIQMIKASNPNISHKEAFIRSAKNEGAKHIVPNLRPQPLDIKKRTPRDKSQRIPTLYNRFIKEEIQRIKDSNPNISHKEAFRRATKSWAHFPHIKKLGLWLEHFPHIQKVGTKLENNEHHLNLDENKAGLYNPPNNEA